MRSGNSLPPQLHSFSIVKPGYSYCQSSDSAAGQGLQIESCMRSNLYALSRWKGPWLRLTTNRFGDSNGS